MKYVYDTLLNFNEEIYDYFEWKETDYIEYAKRIPLLKLTFLDYKNIVNNKIVVVKEFLDKIYDITEIYVDKNIKLIEYACLFTNGEDVIAVEFNNKGYSIMKSKLLLDESNDILEISSILKESDLKYEIVNKENIDRFVTRSEIDKIMFLNREIKMLYKEKNIDKLKYLHYECFNIIEDDLENLNNSFISFLNNGWNEKHKKLYELLRLAYIKK